MIILDKEIHYMSCITYLRTQLMQFEVEFWCSESLWYYIQKHSKPLPHHYHCILLHQPMRTKEYTKDIPNLHNSICGSHDVVGKNDATGSGKEATSMSR